MQPLGLRHQAGARASVRRGGGSASHHLRPREPRLTSILIGSGLGVLAFGVTLASLIAALRGPSKHAETTEPYPIV